MAFNLANDKYAATLSSGYTAGATTLSVTVVPDNVPTLVCVAKGTASETVFSVTGKTLNSLTGVSRLKGYTGDLDTGMPVTCLNNSEFVNQYSAAVSTPESLIQILYGVDGGSTDAYAVSLDVAPTTYTAGLTVAFKANTGNTGACTVNVNSLGAKTIKKNTSEDLTTNDIKAGEVITVIYDGTNFQLQTGIPTVVSYPRAFTWYLDGTSIIADNLGAKYIVPQTMTTVTVRYKLTSGTCSFRLKKNGTEFIAPNNADSTTRAWAVAVSLAAGDVLTLDIWAAASPVNLAVTLECVQ